MEDRVRERGVALSDVPLDELIRLWNEAKTLNRQPA
jgi:hypothetical protein